MNDFNLEMPDMDKDFEKLLTDMMSGKKEDEPIPEIPDDYSLVLLMGLDESGKTSLINKLVYDELFKPMPTDLTEHTKYTYNNKNLFIRELGGRYRFRDSWPELFNDASALIWVVDMIDRGRVVESREELEKVLSHPSIEKIPVLVIFNKIDSRIKMTHEKCDELMQISKLFENRKYKVIETCNLTCENMNDGIQWIIDNIEPKEKTESHQE
ncbi:hypothetical protein M9Y10_045704 [Tritrichomonas musculus]|uniref:ADP-ribosylation factor n=1 Tax=Tritrichomonas musculus TaxID=1915356 RepID=A0ABR2JX79_9EUKA